MTWGRKTGGRQKGTKNKRPGVHAEMRSVRQAFKSAFDQLGGAEALAVWARTNPTEFYKLAARLIPVEIAGSKDEPLTVITRAE